jgi:AraC-like DNA-binding protein
VDEARAAVAVDPRRGLVDLARQLAVSPHHLSRVFSELSGQTFSGYRNRVRVRLALDAIADGERRLARLATELGFADQAHLTRVVRSETGRPPAQLRKLLASAHESTSAAWRRRPRSVGAIPDGPRIRPLVEEAEVRRVR